MMLYVRAGGLASPNDRVDKRKILGENMRGILERCR